MIVYLGVVLWIIIFGGLQTQKARYYIADDGTYSVYNSLVYIFLLILPFIFVGGLRYNVGTDFFNYYMMNPEKEEIIRRISTWDEPFVYIVAYYCRLIWNNGGTVIFVEQLITILLVFHGLRKFDIESYTLPLLLYIFYCGWLFTFNGVRQAMACSFIFAFSKCKEGERFTLLKDIIICIIASSMHRTAVFMIPFLVLSKRRYSFRMIGIAAFVGYIISTMGSYAYSFMGGTAENVGEYAIREIHNLRVVVAFVPAILCVYALIQNCENFIDKNSVLMNMATFNAFITFGTRNSAYLNRFSYFTVLYCMCLIPKAEEITGVRNLFRGIVACLFFLYFLYDIRDGGQFYWIFD